MGGELAISVAPGTSVLPVQETEDKKNPQKGHSRCILLMPRTCNTGCEVVSHISIRKMLHEKILAIDTLANYRWFSVGIFLLQDVRLFSQPGGGGGGGESNDIPPATRAVIQFLPNWFFEIFLK